MASILDFLLVHGFFSIRKVDKNSNIMAVSLASDPHKCPLMPFPSCTSFQSPLYQNLPLPHAERDSSRASSRSLQLLFLIVVRIDRPDETQSDDLTVEPTVQPVRQQGCDASGKLWLQRYLEAINSLESDQKHVDLRLQADREIKDTRRYSLDTLQSIREVITRRLFDFPLAPAQESIQEPEAAKAVQILLSLILLQTYDENEDALDILEVIAISRE